MRNKIRILIAFALTLICHLVLPPQMAANAAVVSKTKKIPSIALPAHQWQDDRLLPKAIIVALHGATLHGRSYETLAAKLAADGALVIAPDYCGFGSNYQSNNSNIAYRRSQQEIVKLLQWLRSEHPDLPLFCLGESVGANMGIQLAAQNPTLIDGLILSSIGVGTRLPLGMKMFRDVCYGLTHPGSDIDLSPYIMKSISEDPYIVSERVSDPLGRNHMPLMKLIATVGYNHTAARSAKRIPSKMPVMLIAGALDRMFKPTSMVKLVRNSASRNTQIVWLPDKGHILLETKYLSPNVVNAVSSFIHSQSNTIVAENNRRRLAAQAQDTDSLSALDDPSSPLKVPM